MHLRPLANTGLSISPIGLGGHWRTHDGRRYHDSFVDDEVPADVLANRHEIVSLCTEAGVNYIDITTGAECLAYGRVLSGRRDRFIIGADDYQWSARNPACLTVPALVANVERCLRRLRTDYLDIWRVISEVHGRNTDDDLRTIIEAADQLRRAGKVRVLGLSSHHPGWLARALAEFDQFRVALMPCLPPMCTTPTGRDGLTPRPLAVAAARNIAVIAIKPLAGGLLLNSSNHEPLDSTGTHHRLASAAFRHILQHRPGVTTVAVGMTTPTEARTAMAALTAPPLCEDERNWLIETTRSRLGTLPAEYAWLADWQEAR